MIKLSTGSDRNLENFFSTSNYISTSASQITVFNTPFQACSHRLNMSGSFGGNLVVVITRLAKLTRNLAVQGENCGEAYMHGQFLSEQLQSRFFRAWNSTCCRYGHRVIFDD